MLPKQHRIPAFAIRTVIRTGKRIDSPTLSASVTHTPTQACWRGAIVVSTAVDKRAVVRNRIKRVISESMMHFEDRILASMDIVFRVKKGFLYDTQEQATTQVKLLLDHII
jgi:ribonuclease P protein component